jgi:hypothetical protein
MQFALEKAGLTDEYLAKKIHEGANAFRVDRFAVDGHVTEEKVDADFGTRQKYLELTAKLRGDIIDKVQQETTFPEGVPAYLPPEEEKRLTKEFNILFNRNSHLYGLYEILRLAIRGKGAMAPNDNIRQSLG